MFVITKFGHQGDLNFKAVDSLPKGVLEPLMIDEARGGITLALGEHTGHAHTLIADSEETTIEALRALDGKQYIVIKGGNAKLLHGTFTSPGKIDERETDKHGMVVFTPGIYEQGYESEYDPFTKKARQVVD